MAVSDRIKQAVAEYQDLRKELNNSLIVNGKTLREWHDIFFNLQIPQDIDPIICRKLSIEVMRLNQLASTYYTMANARTTSVCSTADYIYREKYKDISHAYKQEHGKPAASTYLEIMAKQQTDDVKALAMVSEIEKNFWRDILNYITRIRKQLENITMNNALMYKIEGYAETPGGITEPLEEDAEDDDVPEIF